MTLKCWCGNTAQEDTAGVLICLDSAYHDPAATGEPEHVTTLYVAGPMSGLPQNNYPAFHKAQAVLESVGYTVVNPASYGVPGKERVHYVDLIREDLRLMLDCHGIALLDRWWTSSGARNEVTIGGTLKMPSRTVADWLNLIERPHRSARDWFDLEEKRRMSP